MVFTGLKPETTLRLASPFFFCELIILLYFNENPFTAIYILINQAALKSIFFFEKNKKFS